MLGPIEFSLQHHFKPDQSAFEELETYDRRGQDSNSVQPGWSRGKVFRNEAFDNRFHKPTIDWQLATQSPCKPASAQPFINRITFKQ